LHGAAHRQIDQPLICQALSGRVGHNNFHEWLQG
jgi:hypothetical protein